MATQFSRLYRELCQSNPHDPVYDIQYTKERKGVLASLGHAVNIHKDVQVQICKHHGKAARRRAPAARLKAISLETSNKMKREREVRMTSMRTAKVHALTEKIQGLMREDKFVSKHLWAQYDQIYGESNDSGTATTNSSKSMNQLKIGSNKNTVQKRAKSSVRIDYSRNKWSKAEREKLNTIYWELKRPTTRNIGHWNNYFLEFASVFRIYFSERSIESVMDKVKYMYATRQFTEPGESLYWNSVAESQNSSYCPGVEKVSKKKISCSSISGIAVSNEKKSI